MFRRNASTPSSYIWLMFIVYMSVCFVILYMVVCLVCFCLIFKLCVFIVMFIYSYCYVCSVLYIPFSLCGSMYCFCVNMYCTTATGCQTTAVNKYIISYHSEGIQFHRIGHLLVSNLDHYVTCFSLRILSSSIHLNQIVKLKKDVAHSSETP